MPTSASISIARMPGLRAGKPGMQREQPGDLPPDGNHRVERGARALRDHGDPRAADLPHLLLAQHREIAAVEHDGAGVESAGRADQPQDRRRGHGLAGARLADQPQDLARRTSTAHGIDGLDVAGVGGEADREVPDVDQAVMPYAPHARIEEVAQPVADEVEGQHQ